MPEPESLLLLFISALFS
ncbi:PEP-CTERM sorting domain-containing protein, partial [Fusobacterium ulcerans]